MNKTVWMFRNFLWPHTDGLWLLRSQTCVMPVTEISAASQTDLYTINSRCLTSINAKMMNWDFDGRKKEVVRGKKDLRKPICCTAQIDWLHSYVKIILQLNRAASNGSGYFLKHCKYNHSIHLKQVWALGLILVLIFGVSNGSRSLSLGSLYDPGLGLWHLYLIPVLISGLSDWSWSLSLGSVWSSSWSLGFLTDSDLEVGFSVWSSTWSLCCPCHPSLDIWDLCDSGFNLLVFKLLSVSRRRCWFCFPAATGGAVQSLW